MDATKTDVKSNMYQGTKTWNPFKGCSFDCTYCRPSFQQQAKRQKQLCSKCYQYVPHCHPDRLDRLPSYKTIFACGDADISFCPPKFTRQIIDRIREHNKRCPYKTFYFQSKRPAYFKPFLSLFPPNVILLTTLETNRDAGYRKVSKALLPSKRYQQFKDLDYSRKVVTIEPVMDFDDEVFPQWIVDLRPEYVWLGLNSHPECVTLPEPSLEKLRKLVEVIQSAGIQIQGKELRGLDLGIPE
jgi:hypothetical protein